MLGIGIGSKTSTGGTVIEGNVGIIFNGLVASSIGHKASCPACKKGSGPIIAVGSREVHLPAGPAARAGDYIGCGCPPGSNVLIAQGTVTIGSGGMSRALSEAPVSHSKSVIESVAAEHIPALANRPSIHADRAGLRSELMPSTTPSVPTQPQPQPRYKWQIGANYYSIRQAAYLPAEGVGVNGSYFIKGSLVLNEGSLFISAMGFTAAKHLGRVHFNAAVTVSLNGREIHNAPLVHGADPGMWPADEFTPIGSVSLDLPEAKQTDQASITIRGGYIYSTPEGNAVPLPPTGAITLPLEIVEEQ